MLVKLIDLQLLYEFELVVEKYLNWYLSMYKFWNLYDYILWLDGKNYYVFGGQDWDFDQSKFFDVVQVVMVQNLVIEDNLLLYYCEIVMNMGMDGVWGQWVNCWIVEENWYGIVLCDYLVVI